MYATNGLPVKEQYQWPEGAGVQALMSHCSLKLCEKLNAL